LAAPGLEGAGVGGCGISAIGAAGIGGSALGIGGAAFTGSASRAEVARSVIGGAAVPGGVLSIGTVTGIAGSGVVGNGSGLAELMPDRDRSAGGGTCGVGGANEVGIEAGAAVWAGNVVGAIRDGGEDTYIGGSVPEAATLPGLVTGTGNAPGVAPVIEYQLADAFGY
jgi:hypothetical protein